jgi:BioD-like phosphotransacetylase family protein
MAKNCKIIENAMFEAVVYFKPGMNDEHEDTCDLVVRLWPTSENAVTSTVEFTISTEESDAALERIHKMIAEMDADTVASLIGEDGWLKEMIFG